MRQLSAYASGKAGSAGGEPEGGAVWIPESIIAIVVAALIVIALLWLWAGARGSAALTRVVTRRADPARGRGEQRAGGPHVRRPRNARLARASRGRRPASRPLTPKAGRWRRRHLEAASVDPDVDEREAADRYDQEREGVARFVHGWKDDGEVEHHEETRTADQEHERHSSATSRATSYATRSTAARVRSDARNGGPPARRTPYARLAADGPVPAAVAAQQQPRAPGLLPA